MVDVYILFLLRSIEALRFIGTEYCITIYQKLERKSLYYLEVAWKLSWHYNKCYSSSWPPFYCTLLVCRSVDMTKAAVLLLHGYSQRSLASRLAIMRNTSPRTRHY
jgi:hypothetical protein